MRKPLESDTSKPFRLFLWTLALFLVGLSGFVFDFLPIAALLLPICTLDVIFTAIGGARSSLMGPGWLSMVMNFFLIGAYLHPKIYRGDSFRKITVIEIACMTLWMGEFLLLEWIR